MKRIPGLLSALAILCLAGTLAPALAQSDEVSLIQLTGLINATGALVRGTSDDGKRIVFESTSNFTGQNADFNNEIFVYDADLKTIIQITDTKNVTDPADATKILLNVSNNAPAISGDGTRIVFSSNSGTLSGTTNDDGNQEIYLATLPRSSTTVTFVRITDTGGNDATETIKEIFTNYTPTVNSDGTLIAFVSTRRVFNALANGTPAFTAANENTAAPFTDGNAEIFLYNLTARSYTQVTRSRDIDATVNFQVRGFNGNPFLSGDGSKLVFISGFDYTGNNSGTNRDDYNAEIFIYNVGDAINTFTQVTNTTTASNAPLLPFGGAVNVLSAGTRHFNHQGTLLVFESSGNLSNNNSDKTREVFLYNVTTKAFTQVTNQTLPASPTIDDLNKVDFNFFPSINSTGTFLAFGSVMNLVPTSPSGLTTDNADGSRELFRYDIVNSTSTSPKFRQLTFTNVPLLLDPRTTTIAGFPDNIGSRVNFPSADNLTGTNNTASSELFQVVIRPITSQNSQAPALANAASFDGTQVARGSLVAAFGTQLANATGNAPSADLPYEINGVSVTVAGFVAAQVIFVSAGQVNFVFPAGIAPTDSISYTINNNGVVSKGTIKVADASPGVFAVTGSGAGPGVVQCARVADNGMGAEISSPPCSVGNSASLNVLTIYGTGWRNAATVTVKIGDLSFAPTFAGAQPNFPGLDQINVTLTTDLAGKTDQSLLVTTVTTTGVTTNSQNNVTVSFQSGVEGVVTVANAASFSSTAVARGSIAIAFGTNLANTTLTAPSGTAPLTLGGVSVQVGGVAAGLVFVSPSQINFIVPAGVAAADLVAVRVNNNGTFSSGRVKVADVAPGVFTANGSGSGPAAAQCGRVMANNTVVFSSPPCSVGTDASPNFLVLTGTGWRNATAIKVTIGGVDLTPTSFGPQGAPGVDQITVNLVSSLAGRTDAEIIVTATVPGGTTTVTSQSGVTISFTP